MWVWLGVDGLENVSGHLIRLEFKTSSLMVVATFLELCGVSAWFFCVCVCLHVSAKVLSRFRVTSWKKAS